MKRSLILAALLLATPAAATSYDHSGDIICKLTDNSGQVNFYEFANNTENASDFGGTFVETLYASPQKSVELPPGRRPVWTYYANKFGGMTLASQADRGWSIVIGVMNKNNGVVGGRAVLDHNGSVVGFGGCMRPSEGPEARQ